MIITPDEKIMYEVMRAVYTSGIPISFKGSMVLKACLMEAGYIEDTRHTVDIDANWNSDSNPTEEQMTESIQNALDQQGLNLKVSLFRMYGEKRSAGFELTDKHTDELLFTMDMDVNRSLSPTVVYEVDGLKFRGAAPIQMIADKTAVISTDKVFRRIKDVIDLYYCSRVFSFDTPEVLKTLKNSNKELDSFNGFLNRVDELEHSYKKFRFVGNVFKPPFAEVYNAVEKFIKDVLPK